MKTAPADGGGFLSVRQAVFLLRTSKTACPYKVCANKSKHSDSRYAILTMSTGVSDLKKQHPTDFPWGAVIGLCNSRYPLAALL